MFARIAVFFVLTCFPDFTARQPTGNQPASPEIGLAQWEPDLAALLMLLMFRKGGHRFVFFSKETPLYTYIRKPDMCPPGQIRLQL